MLHHAGSNPERRGHCSCGVGSLKCLSPLQASLAQMPDPTDLITFFDGLAAAINATNSASACSAPQVVLAGSVRRSIAAEFFPQCCEVGC